MFSRLFSHPGASGRALSGGSWPRVRIDAAIKKRFGDVQGPHARDEFVLYGVLENDVAFVIVLHHPVGRAGDIDQIIFYTRFEGFGADGAKAAAMNRNLHLAAVQIRDAALDMFAGVEPSGEFSEAALNAFFDAWKRDLSIVIGMLTGAASYASAFGFDRDERILALATNTARADGAAAQLFASFIGPARKPVVCTECGGRGKLGFIARLCGKCDGSGLIERRR
ncbi:MAG: hypothetical protein HXY23_13090 [Parvularculaceae bacterium]|nr:hypothetical protein [Parvularculaceae bacterium]